jgi:hypothetical protein
MTEAHTHEHAEHKAPAKKRVTRKKVIHHKTHAELEIEAFERKLDAIFEGTVAVFNSQQVKALYKKIAKRQAQVQK